MKIALVPHTYLPNIGGVENYVSRLFRDLKRDGNDAYVLTSDVGIENRICVTKSDSNVIYFRALPLIFRNPFTLGLAIHLWKHEYDIIHAHSIHAFPTLISLIFKKRSKFIITAHGVAPDNSDLLLNFIWRLYIPVAKYLCKHSDKLIVLGQKEKVKLIELLDVDPDKIKVIPNGIDIPNMPDSEIIKSFTIRYQLSGYKIVLFTGRISPIKNPEALLNAFSIVNRVIKDSKLLMLGPISDAYKNELLKLARTLSINDNVVFTGEVSQLELFASYVIANCFVSLGAWEGLPTTMLEAMFFSKPCVMFNSGGIEEAIQDGKTGFLIHIIDNDIIAEKILFILRNNEQMNKIGENARAEILKKYLWIYCFNEIKCVYNSVKFIL